MPLAGYGARTAPSSGVLRPLEVNVMVVAYDDRPILLVTLDAIAVDRGFVHRVRQAVARHGIDADHVLVAASHTHSGPAGLRVGGAEQAVKTDPVVVRGYLDAIRRATDAAFAGLGPAQVSVRAGRVEGVAADRNDPLRPVDTTATVLRVTGPRGTTIGYLWHFACHPTVLGADNTLLSPDLPGEVRAALRGESPPAQGADPTSIVQPTARSRKGMRAPVDNGDDLPVLYLGGTAGDVSTRFTRREQTPRELTRLAGLVTRAWTGAWRPVRLAPPRVRRDPVALPAAASDPEAARGRLAAATSALAAMSAGPRRRVLETEIQGLRRRLSRPSSGEPVLAEAHTMVLGDLALAALPGEPVTAVGRAVRAASRYPVTLPVGYAGDYIGYLTTADMTTGYEAEAALTAPGAAELAAAALIDGIHAMEER
jgi:neutral ceramidase